MIAHLPHNNCQCMSVTWETTGENCHERRSIFEITIDASSPQKPVELAPQNRHERRKLAASTRGK